MRQAYSRGLWLLSKVPKEGIIIRLLKGGGTECVWSLRRWTVLQKRCFRQVWRARFGGADRYFLPFISPTDQHIFTDKMRRELSAEPDELPALVPQIMTRRADDFLWAADVLAGMGFQEVNLNLGCPSGTVTAKGKGSGLLLYPDELAAMLEEICRKSPLPVSVKTRLGYREPEEFPALLEIFNRCPVKSLIVHPRTRPEKYKGPIHTDAFALAAEQSRNPLCYNGEIRTPEDAAEIQARFPSLDALMIGRGAVADPAPLPEASGRPRRHSGRASGLYRPALSALSGFLRRCGTVLQNRSRLPENEGGLVLPDPSL